MLECAQWALQGGLFPIRDCRPQLFPIRDNLNYWTYLGTQCPDLQLQDICLKVVQTMCPLCDNLNYWTYLSTQGMKVVRNMKWDWLTPALTVSSYWTHLSSNDGVRSWNMPARHWVVWNMESYPISVTRKNTHSVILFRLIAATLSDI